MSKTSRDRIVDLSSFRCFARESQIVEVDPFHVTSRCHPFPSIPPSSAHLHHPCQPDDGENMPKHTLAQGGLSDASTGLTGPMRGVLLHAAQLRRRGHHVSTMKRTQSVRIMKVRSMKSGYRSWSQGASSASRDIHLVEWSGMVQGYGGHLSHSVLKDGESRQAVGDRAGRIAPSSPVRTTTPTWAPRQVVAAQSDSVGPVTEIVVRMQPVRRDHEGQKCNRTWESKTIRVVETRTLAKPVQYTYSAQCMDG
nr:hypothetical protein CFP56_22241 [Quercus suber]